MTPNNKGFSILGAFLPGLRILLLITVYRSLKSKNLELNAFTILMMARHYLTSHLALHPDPSAMDTVLKEILDRAARAAGGRACARARAAGGACTAGSAGGAGPGTSGTAAGTA